jgi:hypothetical protein
MPMTTENEPQLKINLHCRELTLYLRGAHREHPDLPFEDEDGGKDLYRLGLDYAKQRGIKWKHVAPALAAVEAEEPEEDQALVRNPLYEGLVTVDEARAARESRAKKRGIVIAPPPKRARQKIAYISNSVESIDKKPTLMVDPCSLNAMRIAISMLFFVHAKTDKHFWTHKTTCYKLSQALGLKYYLTRAQAEQLLKEVAGVVLTINTDNVFSAVPVTAIAKLDKDTGDIKLKLNPELQPYLLNLRNYRQLHPSILKLRTQRAVLLYQYLRRFVHLENHKKRVPMKDLQRVMQSTAPWKEFRRFHLDPVLKDINEKTELQASYKVERPDGYRHRGKVEALVFKVIDRQAPKNFTLKRQSRGPKKFTSFRELGL